MILICFALNMRFIIIWPLLLLNMILHHTKIFLKFPKHRTFWHVLLPLYGTPATWNIPTFIYLILQDSAASGNFYWPSTPISLFSPLCGFKGLYTSYSYSYHYTYHFKVFFFLLNVIWWKRQNPIALFTIKTAYLSLYQSTKLFIYTFTYVVVYVSIYLYNCLSVHRCITVRSISSYQVHNKFIIYVKWNEQRKWNNFTEDKVYPVLNLMVPSIMTYIPTLWQMKFVLSKIACSWETMFERKWI